MKKGLNIIEVVNTKELGPTDSIQFLSQCLVSVENKSWNINSKIKEQKHQISMSSLHKYFFILINHK